MTNGLTGSETDHDLIIIILERVGVIQDTLESGKEEMEKHDDKIQALEKELPLFKLKTDCEAAHRFSSGQIITILIVILGTVLAGFLTLL